MLTGIACALCLFFGYVLGWCNRVKVEQSTVVPGVHNE